MHLRERTSASGALPTPAPLPSLTSALSRRAALFGAVTATGFLGAAGAAALGQGYTAQHTPSVLDPADARLVALSADPIVDMYRRAKALRAVHDHPDTSVPEADAAYDGISELRSEAFDTGATTPAGALASLQWARDEFAEYYVETSKEPDWLDLFTLRMIDNAIAVLRAEVSNG